MALIVGDDDGVVMINRILFFMTNKNRIFTAYLSTSIDFPDIVNLLLIVTTRLVQIILQNLLK